MAGFLTKAAGLAFLVSAAAGHMIMASPKPFGNPDNGPISSATYPCKVQGSPDQFFSRTQTEKWSVGSTQKLSFKGSAVHSGGSCQLALTKDLVPTKSSTWQVILSIHGGCPSKDGNGPSDYDFKIPAEIAAGEYVFAWTWISKLAGQPEYYMNCAPVTVTAGAAKRDENFAVMEPRATLPNLFVANLAEINSCKAGPGIDPVFPDPGPYVITPGSGSKLEEIKGNCSPGGTGGSGSGSGSGAGNGGSAAPSSSSAAPPKPSTTSANVGNPQASSTAAKPSTTGGSASTQPGGVFITVKPSASSSSGGAAQPTQSTFTTSTIKDSASTTQNSPAPTTTGGGNDSGSGSGAGGKTGSCSNEGTFNCVGGTQYQQCASGSWSALRPMAAGTSCKTGESASLWARGNLRGRRVRHADN